MSDQPVTGTPDPEVPEPVEAAPVAAVAVEPATGTAAAVAAPERPTDVAIVTVLALLAALGDVIAGVAYLIEGPDGPPAYIAWLVLLLGLATAAVAGLLFTGSEFARTLIAIIMLVRIIVHVIAWINVGSDVAVAAMIEILIATVVLILLYSRESTAFLMGTKK